MQAAFYCATLSRKGNHVVPPRIFAIRLAAKRIEIRRIHHQSRAAVALFFNAGLFNDGLSTLKLARFYAQAIIDSKVEFDMLFGPAYKGIILAAATAMMLAEKGINVPFAYNRKEAKDHGEGGVLVGAPLKGRVLIIDDVISAGTSVRESVRLIQNEGATPAAVAIALDRMEKGTGELSAVQEVEHQYGLPVVAIANFAGFCLLCWRKTNRRNWRGLSSR